jgi:hypothetical protein
MSRNDDRELPNDEFRALKISELELLSVLLGVVFTGNGELQVQANNAKVRTIDENGSLAFKIGSAPRAEVKRRIPIEAEVEDDDGVMIHFLVHVEDGLLSELEIYREDSTSVVGEIDTSKLRLLLL